MGRTDIRVVVAPAQADLLGDFCNKIGTNSP
jgi:hypothetical protein